MKIFNKMVAINIGDTDATGVIFFPKLFEKCVIMLEDFLKSFKLQKYVLTKEFLFPVVHAEADFLEPIFPYDQLDCTMSVERIGDSSITLEYVFSNASSITVAKSKIIHVCIDGNTKQKTKLPEVFKNSFEKPHPLL